MSCLRDLARLLVGDAQQFLRPGTVFVLRPGEDLGQELHGLRVIALLEGGSRLVHGSSDGAQIGSGEPSSWPFLRSPRWRRQRQARLGGVAACRLVTMGDRRVPACADAGGKHGPAASLGGPAGDGDDEALEVRAGRDLIGNGVQELHAQHGPGGLVKLKVDGADGGAGMVWCAQGLASQNGKRGRLSWVNGTHVNR